MLVLRIVLAEAFYQSLVFDVYLKSHKV
jgi:hypothetical protein